MDFINHFVKLYNEKRSDLEEQQLHLNVGLSKIAETVEQVEEMQKSLAVKSQVFILQPPPPEFSMFVILTLMWF